MLSSRLGLPLALVASALFLVGCDRMVTPRPAQLLKDADAKAAENDFPHAIALYEAALDGSASSADTHYRMALFYDDKMSDPLNAVHHFKRYLALAPNGSHAKDANNFLKRDELSLVTSLSGDSVVSRGEAARLKNENLTLRKELEDQRARAKAAIPDKAARAKASPTPTKRTVRKARAVHRSAR